MIGSTWAGYVMLVITHTCDFPHRRILNFAHNHFIGGTGGILARDVGGGWRKSAVHNSAKLGEEPPTRLQWFPNSLQAVGDWAGKRTVDAV